LRSAIRSGYLNTFADISNNLISDICKPFADICNKITDICN